MPQMPKPGQIWTAKDFDDDPQLDKMVVAIDDDNYVFYVYINEVDMADHEQSDAYEASFCDLHSFLNNQRRLL